MEDLDLQVRLKAKGYQIEFVPTAAVVHPWRKLANPSVMAIREESYIYYSIKHGLKVNPLAYAQKLFFFYFSRLKEFPTINNSVLLGKRYLVHLVGFLKHYRSWQKKYRPGI
jgi:GT2 family glycosyltransferase